MSTMTAPTTCSQQTEKSCGNELGPDYPHRGQPGHLYQDRFREPEVAECHSTSSIFRGYSIFMKGKDPRDAHFITSRICGICGDNHATCATYAQNMAFGMQAAADWPSGSSTWAKPPNTCSTTIFFRTIWSALISASRWSRKRIRRSGRKRENDPGAARE